MSPGRAAAQAGHAFLETFLNASDELRERYRVAGGTKIVLMCRDEVELKRLLDDARVRGITRAMVVEDDLPPHDGLVVTALGLGPAPRNQITPITKGLRLM